MPADDAKLHIVYSGGVVYNDKGEFLVIKRSPQEIHAAGQIAYPGGKVDHNDGTVNDILEKNCREEIREETGVEIEDRMQYINSHSFVREDGIYVVGALFLCKYKSGDPRPEPGESDEVFWMKFEDMKKDKMIPMVYKVFELAYNKLKK